MKREYLLAGVTILCWGMLAAVSKLLLREMSAVAVLSWSSLFAAAFLLLCCLFTKRLYFLKDMNARTWLELVEVGLLGVFCYRLCLFFGISRLPAQTAFVLNYLWPACTVLFGRVLLSERLTCIKVLAVALSVLGVIINTAQGNLHFLQGNDPLGILLCLAAAVLYGLYSVLNKKQAHDKFLAMLVAYFCSTACAFGLTVAMGKPIELPAASQMMVLAFIGVVCNALPYLTWALALDRGNTAVIANLAYLTPFVSLAATHFLLKEAVTVYSVLGLALIGVGILFQMAAVRKEKA